jgi:hypothetical protein
MVPGVLENSVGGDVVGLSGGDHAPRVVLERILRHGPDDFARVAASPILREHPIPDLHFVRVGGHTLESDRADGEASVPDGNDPVPAAPLRVLGEPVPKPRERCGILSVGKGIREGQTENLCRVLGTPFDECGEGRKGPALPQETVRFDARRAMSSSMSR